MFILIFLLLLRLANNIITYLHKAKGIIDIFLSTLFKKKTAFFGKFRVFS